MGIEQKTAIVVPCYNEAERLQAQPFLNYCLEQPRVSFVFVDDGSSDVTFRVLQELAAKNAGISVLRLEKNFGKAEAVRRGVSKAFGTDAELVGFWDADLATPLHYIEEFAAALEVPEAQMVFGSRVRLLGRRIERDAVRHYMGRLFATFAAIALQLPIYDTQCGAKLFRANPLFREVFRQPFELGWSFDVELFARLKRSARDLQSFDPQQHLIEFPLNEWFDAPGSKLKAKHFPRIALDLGKLYLLARK